VELERQKVRKCCGTCNVVDFIGLQMSNEVPHQVLGQLWGGILVDELLHLGEDENEC
jgi:hypothetical protein